MTLTEVKGYLESIIDCDNWYVGKIDANKEYCIGIFSTQSPAPTIPIGGMKNSSYASKAVSILVHWGKFYSPAEEKAQEVFNALFGQEVTIGGKRVVKMDFRTSEPVGVGTDDKGVYEFVINFVIYFMK